MKPIVSAQIRIRYPAEFEVGQGSIVDDFSYFAARVCIGRWCHVASSCSVAGGPERLFTLGDLSSLSSGVKIWCASNDFARDLIVIRPDRQSLGDEPISGDVSLGRYTGVGANSVIMPDNIIPEGVSIGALSFVPARAVLEPWTVYAGVPVRPVGSRDRARVLAQAARFRELVGDPAQ